MHSETLLSARGLRKVYGTTAALDSVGFDIARGEIVCLIGRNGAGKTTLLDLLAGLKQPTSGEMHLAGEIYRPADRAEALAAGVGIVTQRLSVDGNLTVAEALVRETYRASLTTDRQIEFARQALADYGSSLDPLDRLGDLERADITVVELLRLAYAETQLILLDEITATFNDHEISLFHALANKLAAEGRAIVSISHRLDEVAVLADRVLIIRDGRLVRELQQRSATTSTLFTSLFGGSFEQRRRPEPTDSGPALIELRDAVGTRGLAPVNLDIRAGEVLGVTGLRRSGISELVALLVGADRLTGGSMRLDGADVRLNGIVDALRHGIGYLSDRDDEIGIDETATLGEALNAVQGADGAGSNSVIEDMRRLQKVVRTIESLGIRAATLDHGVENLSGGDKQKIALARWLRSGCRILVLNHPTRGIDAAARKAIYELSDELLAAGTAVVLVSSDASELLAHSHRIAVLREREIFDVYQNEDVTEDIVMQVALGAAEEQKAQV